jgi:hypothetical protein
MRRRLRAIVLVLTAALFATGTLIAIAPPAGAQSIPGFDCGSTTLRWLFWPKGHGEIKSQGFPAFPTPHLEVYAGTGKKFPDDQQVGYADPTTATTADSCTPSPISPGTATITKATTKTKQLVCRFASSPVFFAASNQAGGYSLLAYVDGTSVVSATLADTGSKLQYDGKACKLKKAPK